MSKRDGGTPLVLAIDDDPGVLKLLELEFEEQGFQLITARDGETGLELARDRHPDLIVLDLMLPDIHGLEVMRRLREHESVPVIMLTARGTDAEKIRGLALGADDYLAKPFNPAELSARVRAVLRRGLHAEDVHPVLVHGDLRIDLERRLVTRHGEQIALTRTGWRLLEVLARHAGRVLGNEEILSRAWGSEYRDDLQYLRVWIARLRGKLDPLRAEPELIQTFPGLGYMLRAEREPLDTASAGTTDKSGEDPATDRI